MRRYVYHEIRWWRYPAIWIAISFWGMSHVAPLGVSNHTIMIWNYLWVVGLYVWAFVDLVRMFREELPDDRVS